MANHKLRSPVSTWIGRFGQDCWFHPQGWLWGLGRSLLAVPQTVLRQTGPRIRGLGTHLTRGVRAPRRTRMWWLRLACKFADLFCLGEILNALGMFVKHNTRPLSFMETVEARRIFGDSLDYKRVRLDEWSLIAHIANWVYQRRTGKRSGHMAVTIFNTIHCSRRISASAGNNDMAWLIHELTHAAQYQHIGSQFLFEALLAQRREGYDYGGAEALAARDFPQFNREQQGDIVMDYYNILLGRKETPGPQRQSYERVIGQLRAGKI